MKKVEHTTLFCLFICSPFFVFLLCFVLLLPAFASEQYLLADFRHRPPEMVLIDGQRSGPLKVILEEAAAKINYTIKWRNAHFARSIKDLEQEKIDIIPRMIKNEDREKFSYFLGPIGYQKKDILFLVKKGQENLINNYQDLKGLQIEVKRKTAYFTRFDKDDSLNKRENLDDNNMAEMFKHGRFDTMPVLDKLSLEAALKKVDMDNYSYANYKHINRIGNYYGLSKKPSNAKLYPKLNQSLLHLVNSGRVATIYKEFGLIPPSTQ